MPWINRHRRLWLGLLGILVGMEVVEISFWFYDETRGGGDGRLRDFSFGPVFANLRLIWTGLLLLLLGLLVPNRPVQGFTVGLLFSALLLSLLEGLAALVVKTGLVQSPAPSYQFATPIPLVATLRPFHADLHPDFGVWHYADSTLHEGDCFRVTYHKNAFGARDRERNLSAAQPRVIVLGDSFVEGYGVGLPERFTNRLEAATGREFMNFGTSGHFSPTQSYLLYRHLARRFDHRTVVLCVLPWNDFIEDDYEACRTHPALAMRYRPYWVGDSPDYQLRYCVDSLQKSIWHPARIHQLHAVQQRGERPALVIPRSFAQRLVHGLSSYSYLYNLIHSRQTPSQAPSRYFHYRPDEYHRLLHSIRCLKKEARNAKLVVVTLPTRDDFREAAQHRQKTPLVAQLETDLHREGIGYVDLLARMQQRQPAWESLFFTCDGHWNASGHALAAECLRADAAFAHVHSSEK